jgi:hypothetical protein
VSRRKGATHLANSDDTAKFEPNPCIIQFELRNGFERTIFMLESYTANGPPRNEVPVVLKFTPQDAASPSSNVIFDLPYPDRLHTIFLRYRNVENMNIGFDICTIVELEGPRNESNGFERAKQTTIIRYITSRQNCDGPIETAFTTSYSKTDSRMSKRSKGSANHREDEPLEYVVNVEHSYKSLNLLDFGTTIHITPRKPLDNQEQMNDTRIYST